MLQDAMGSRHLARLVKHPRQRQKKKSLQKAGEGSQQLRLAHELWGLKASSSGLQEVHPKNKLLNAKLQRHHPNIDRSLLKPGDQASDERRVWPGKFSRKYAVAALIHQVESSSSVLQGPWVPAGMTRAHSVRWNLLDFYFAGSRAQHKI